MGDLLFRLDKKGKENYFGRAARRKRKMNLAWNDLNEFVVGYIRQNINPIPESLPYRENGTQ